MKNFFLNLIRSLVRAVAGRGLGLRRIPGLTRAYEFVYAKLRPKGIVLTEVQGSKMYVNLDDQNYETESIGESLFITGVWERMQTEIFKSLVAPGMTILDLGAHFGYYTLLASKLVGENGRVFSFEPDATNYELLSKNVRINDCRNVSLIHKAVSDKVGHTRLYLNPGNFGVRSLAPGNAPQDSKFLEIETVNLDSLFEAGTLGPRVDFIKMDVEGAEGLALKGARKIMSGCLPAVMMEFNPSFLENMGTDPSQLLHWMEALGYAIHVIDTGAGNVRPLNAEGALALSRELGARDLLITKSDTSH